MEGEKRREVRVLQTQEISLLLSINEIKQPYK
jgi:hypothetical protein